MVKFIQVISLVLILLNVTLGQAGNGCVTGENRPELEVRDTIRYLNIPERSESAIGGLEFVRRVTGLNVTDREKVVAKEILSGNVPSFSRKLWPLKIRETVNAKHYELVLFTVCDYMAIGSDQDFLYIPMTPSMAQRLADSLHCSLPTKKMVDIIYSKAGIKLKPQPIAPSDKMITVPVFKQHTDSIKQQITEKGLDRSADIIIAGHKKDIIISNEIYSADRDYGRVVIYGWHLDENSPIQPVYNGHNEWYADYSHGVRLIADRAIINGHVLTVTDILQDPIRSVLLSSEGVTTKTY